MSILDLQRGVTVAGSYYSLGYIFGEGSKKIKKKIIKEASKQSMVNFDLVSTALEKSADEELIVEMLKYIHKKNAQPFNQVVEIEDDSIHLASITDLAILKGYSKNIVHKIYKAEFENKPSLVMRVLQMISLLLWGPKEEGNITLERLLKMQENDRGEIHFKKGLVKKYKHNLLDAKDYQGNSILDYALEEKLLEEEALLKLIDEMDEENIGNFETKNIDKQGYSLSVNSTLELAIANDYSDQVLNKIARKKFIDRDNAYALKKSLIPDMLFRGMSVNFNQEIVAKFGIYLVDKKMNVSGQGQNVFEYAVNNQMDAEVLKKLLPYIKTEDLKETKSRICMINGKTFRPNTILDQMILMDYEQYLIKMVVDKVHGEHYYTDIESFIESRKILYYPKEEASAEVIESKPSDASLFNESAYQKASFTYKEKAKKAFSSVGNLFKEKMMGKQVVQDSIEVVYHHREKELQRLRAELASKKIGEIESFLLNNTEYADDLIGFEINRVPLYQHADRYKWDSQLTGRSIAYFGKKDYQDLIDAMIKGEGDEIILGKLKTISASNLQAKLGFDVLKNKVRLKPKTVFDLAVLTNRSKKVLNAICQKVYNEKFTRQHAYRSVLRILGKEGHDALDYALDSGLDESIIKHLLMGMSVNDLAKKYPRVKEKGYRALFKTVATDRLILHKIESKMRRMTEEGAMIKKIHAEGRYQGELSKSKIIKYPRAYALLAHIDGRSALKYAIDSKLDRSVIIELVEHSEPRVIAERLGELPEGILEEALAANPGKQNAVLQMSGVQSLRN